MTPARTVPAHPHPAVHARGITVRYGDDTALADVGLDVHRGRVCALVGMNGSGKSTLFKTLTGLVRPDAGRIRIAGTAPADARKAGDIGYVPQSEEVDWDFPVSVRDVVMMGRHVHQGLLRRPRPRDVEAVDRALAQVRLSDLGGRQIGRLSGGQRKRVFIARCIAQGAQVLLLDEPFAGVDTASQATIVRLLRALAADGRTIVVSTHDLQALPRLADEAVLLRRRVLLHAPIHEALRPDHVAAAFGLARPDGADGFPRPVPGAGQVHA